MNVLEQQMHSTAESFKQPLLSQYKAGLEHLYQVTDIPKKQFTDTQLGKLNNVIQILHEVRYVHHFSWSVRHVSLAKQVEDVLKIYLGFAEYPDSTEYQFLDNLLGQLKLSADIALAFSLLFESPNNGEILDFAKRFQQAWYLIAQSFYFQTNSMLGPEWLAIIIDFAQLVLSININFSDLSYSQRLEMSRPNSWHHDLMLTRQFCASIVLQYHTHINSSETGNFIQDERYLKKQQKRQAQFGPDEAITTNSHVEKLPAQKSSSQPWWEKIVGTCADDPEYDEAMKLGQQYRASLSPQMLDTPGN